jgi:2-polyprenyl-6-methoxyphenol hydroxylase-like FAD-dependent oxidoreductase
MAEPLLAPTPVLIAGGGPVGLATAVELAHHGVASVVVERRPEVSWLRPRAKTTSARTMEHFRRWGLADTLRSRAPLPVAWSDEAIFCTSLLGREITRFDRCFGLELAGSELVAEPGQQVAQPLVEQVLREAVAASPLASLVTGAEVVAVGQTADDAWADVATTGGDTQRIHAAYIVGCEGARSLVRDAMGVQYEGGDDFRPNYNVVFQAPGLADRVTHGPAVHYWIINPAQPGLVGRLDLDQTWWCIAQGIDAARGEAATDLIIRNLIGADVAVTVLATDSWRARMLLADHYSRGRLFIAGDAAHQNPPWGGHGFNTGIGDAVNLGWKLAAVINGWGGPDLLDSYEAERRPIARRTIEEAVRNMSTLAPELSDAGLAGTREQFERARPGVALAIQRNKDSEFHSLPLTLGYDYRTSPIVITDHCDERAGKEWPPSTGEPGCRLPHRWLGPDDSLYDHLGHGFTLLGDVNSTAGQRLATAAAARRMPLLQIAMDEAERHSLFGGPLSLVRPDQHLAWSGDDTADPDVVIRRLVGAQPASMTSETSSTTTGPD